MARLSPVLCDVHRSVEFTVDGHRLGGVLHVPTGAVAVVAFAHGSGSSRHSPRNQYVAGELHAAGLATLLFDLLDEEEARDRRNVFDIPFLAERLRMAARWLRQSPETADLPLGYFGASTGAAAALVAAAQDPTGVQAVVSRGGRPDLAQDLLPTVRAPTLLLVGSHDEAVVELNTYALRLLRCPKQLMLVPGATHLFEEPGTLAEVARLARAWFVKYLGPQEACQERGDTDVPQS